VEDQQHAFRLIQESWLEATNRNKLLKRLPLVSDLHAVNPELITTLASAFPWVDHCLSC
jgi:hypothetical protein